LPGDALIAYYPTASERDNNSTRTEEKENPNLSGKT